MAISEDNVHVVERRCSRANVYASGKVISLRRAVFFRMPILWASLSIQQAIRGFQGFRGRHVTRNGLIPLLTRGYFVAHCAESMLFCW